MSLRRHWQVLPPCCVVIAYAAELYVHWRQLGNRVATHFSKFGVPSSWQGKDAFAITSILVIAFTLAFCLVLINAYGCSDPQKRQQLFAVYYAGTVFVGFIFWGLIQQNLHSGALGASGVILQIAAAFGAGAVGYWIGGGWLGSDDESPRP